MTHKQFKILIFVYILATILAIYIIHIPERDSRERTEIVIENYRIAGYLKDTTAGFKDIEKVYYENCLRLLNEKYGKKLKGININESIKPDHVNIYFIAKDPKGFLGHLKLAGNCAYIGYKNVIICDLTFVKEFQRLPDWLKSPATSPDDILIEKVAQAWHANVLLWIVGHEIGHLAYDHCDRHFIFNDEGVQHFIKVFDEKYLKEEEEADGFAIEAAGRVAGPLYFGLAQFINQMGNRFLLEQGHSLPLTLSHEKIVVKAESNIHPPLFLRAVNMMLELCRIYGVESPSEYYESIRNRIEIIR